MQRILITGASRGIGRGTAVALAARGHEVIATARDVTTLAAAGPVDVLVSNAGATVRAPVETVPLAAVQQLIELNTLGALRVAQAVLPGMRAQGPGQLIFVSSIQGRLVIPLIGAYSASKWALEALAETLAIEARPFGVSVHVLEPGAVASGGAGRAQVYLDDANPYRPLLDKIGGFRAEPITTEEVAGAGAVAATVDQGGQAPFRIPVGAPAEAVLAARKAAPGDAPFLAAPLGW
jgi:short-subunit dehydrogenase